MMGVVMGLAHVQEEDRYSMFERIAASYMLVYGVNGLDSIPFEEDELRFHAEAMRRLNDCNELSWHRAIGPQAETLKYFLELRHQLRYLRTGTIGWLEPVEKRMAEQDARRFYVDLAAAVKAHGGKFL